MNVDKEAKELVESTGVDARTALDAMHSKRRLEERLQQGKKFTKKDGDDLRKLIDLGCPPDGDRDQICKCLGFSPAEAAELLGGTQFDQQGADIKTVAESLGIDKETLLDSYGIGGPRVWVDEATANELGYKEARWVQESEVKSLQLDRERAKENDKVLSQHLDYRVIFLEATVEAENNRVRQWPYWDQVERACRGLHYSVCDAMGQSDSCRSPNNADGCRRMYDTLKRDYPTLVREIEEDQSDKSPVNRVLARLNLKRVKAEVPAEPHKEYVDPYPSGFWPLRDRAQEIGLHLLPPRDDRNTWTLYRISRFSEDFETMDAVEVRLAELEASGDWKRFSYNGNI